MNNLKISRTLVVLGFAIGLASLSGTIMHIGDPTFLLIPEHENGATHGWHHVFREAGGDLAAMAVVLIIFFGPKKNRTPSSWIICAILMVGYYAPFWIGMPFNSELSAPSAAAELIHILMTLPTVLGLLLVRGEFYRNPFADEVTVGS